jgi:diguanylate cyclase (GGDEF)-like protein
MLELDCGGVPTMIESVPQSPLSAPPLPAALELNPYNKRQQLLQELLKNSESLLKNRLEVRHLMTRNPVVVPPTMTFDELTSLMQKRRLQYLLVCGRGGEVLGVISDRDLHARSGATAQQLMNFPVRAVAPETLLSPAITCLIGESLSCLPVVENGRLCGLLTTADLVLTLQCMLQLWLRLAQVLQQDSTWSKELDKIAATLNGDLTAAQLADRIAQARQAIQQQVRDAVNAVDLGADVLTGMSNRRGLEEVLDMLLAVNRRFQQPFSLAVVMIDHFQHIRASCGEAVAKPLVKVVARLIEQTVCDSDFVARHRDDGFTVVMPQIALEDAETFCSRLREAAQQDTELEIKLRISAGAVSPEPGENAAELLSRAEAAAV